jgi:antitoxin YefM
LINFTLQLIFMQIASYSEFRQHMKSFLDAVLKTRNPLFITRKHGEDLVVISKDDYTSLQETLYLLSSPKNAQRLSESIKQYEKGKAAKKELED